MQLYLLSLMSQNSVVSTMGTAENSFYWIFNQFPHCFLFVLKFLKYIIMIMNDILKVIIQIEY